MKRGAYFINTSRGEVVDQAALLEACESKGIRAGLDVFAAEPSAGQAPFEDPIGAHASVYGTHHICASTQQAEDAVGEETIRIVSAYANAQPIPNCVNLAAATWATHVVVVRHADRVGVLAHVLHHLRDASMNVQGMQNVVFTGSDAAACARIEVVGEPSAELLASIATHKDIFSATASAL
jgi:D-3-phosphoglycerate dehydrogenase